MITGFRIEASIPRAIFKIPLKRRRLRMTSARAVNALPERRNYPNNLLLITEMAHSSVECFWTNLRRRKRRLRSATRPMGS
jgi:hypothetical protein